LEKELFIEHNKKNPESYAFWEWPQGVGLYGMYRLYSYTKDEEILLFLEKWYRDAFSRGIPEKNINTSAPLLALAYLAPLFKDRQLTDKAEELMNEWADWLMNSLSKTDHGGFQHVTSTDSNTNELWDDTLMMSVLFIAKMGILKNDVKMIEEAKYQFILHTHYLEDRKSNLWFHGWKFDGRHNFADALWARGNAWITITIPEVLRIISEPESAWYRHMSERVGTQIDALLKYQKSLWHTLINHEDSYIETSASAGFLIGIINAIKLGILDTSYFRSVEKALPDLLDFIDDNGIVQNVSGGTPMGNDLDFYRNIILKPMPYGQALTLWALIEVEEYIKNNE
jgi:unsaturated rhamnogalacturonyl hydrolase